MKDYEKLNAKMMADIALRERLLNATIACAAERGLHALTTDQVAKQAGISAGTLFRLFTTKKDLLEEALSLARHKLHADDDVGTWTGETFYEPYLHLWTASTRCALNHPEAFQYWRLYRTTPLDSYWGYPGNLQLGPFWRLYDMIGAVAEFDHLTHLDAWLVASQWSAAVGFLLAPARAPLVYGGTPPASDPVPTQAQVIQRACEASWAGLGLDRNLPKAVKPW
jgi:AcrR family transcriptional regulator